MSSTAGEGVSEARRRSASAESLAARASMSTGGGLSSLDGS